MAKRVFDVLAASFLIVLTAPLLIAAGFAVLASLGRPVLFKQARLRRGGSTFMLRKFRTMRSLTAHERSDAERISRAGAVLRRTRLDELPQLFSVLLGDMSLVGPRPLPPASVTPDVAPLFGRRNRMRPGLTGWAQVNGNTLLSKPEKLALDVLYADNATFRFDLKILVKTVAVLVRGERRDEAAIEEACRYADGVAGRG
jgi:lipopolysaccharide/colanic/teichoic acid biosynthesis glycosyltransferase